MLVSDSEDFGSYLDSVYAVSHSKESVHAYRSGLRQFAKFVEKNHHCTYDEIVNTIKEGKLDVFRMLQGFIIYLDKMDKKPASIKLWLTAVKGYLRYKGIKIYSEDFRQAIRIPKKVVQREEALTKEILVRLLHNLPPKLQTIVLVATSSGMRIGEIVQLKISDVDFSSNPTRIRIRAEITKTRESRETFITSEATRSLKDYLSRFFRWNENESNFQIQNQMIFGRTSLARKDLDETKRNRGIQKNDSELRNTPAMVAKNVLISSLKSYIKKIPELDKSNENGRKMIHFHAFRKFFRTTVGDAVSRDYAEALMGHHFYLDTYYNLPEEKKREMYLKAEPYLTISDFVKIEKDLNKITETQKDLEERQFVFEQLLKKHYVGYSEEIENILKKRFVKT